MPERRNSSRFARSSSVASGRSDGASRAELDTLRAVAVLAVVFQHFADRHRGSLHAALAELPLGLGAWLRSVTGHAHVGVDLFFVLSGLTLSLAWQRASAAGPPPSVASFFERRAARILPAYLVALVAVVVLEPERLAGLSPSALAGVAVRHVTLVHGYVGGGVELIGATWSLTTEASFYLLFPLLAALVLRGSPRRAACVALGLAFAAWALRASLHELVTLRAPHAFELVERRLVFVRLDELVFGMALAHVAKGRPPLPERATVALFVVAGAAFVLGARLEDLTFGKPGGGLPYVLVSLGVTLFVTATFTASDRIRRWLSPRPLTFIGVVSYGVFLQHQLVERLVVARFPCAAGEPALAHALATGLPALALSIAVGAASFLWLERPALEAVARRRR